MLKLNRLGQANGMWVGVPVHERFMMSFRVNPETECWEWQMSKYTPGYGKIYDGSKVVQAHRFSWEYYNRKEIPKGMNVLHSCNVKSCVNPDHLYLGTQKDNINKAVEDGLLLIGEQHPTSKMTEKRVRLVRTVVAQGCTQTLCAKVFGVTLPTINSIVLRKTWKHVE